MRNTRVHPILVMCAFALWEMSGLWGCKFKHLISFVFTFHTGGSCSGGASYLPGETGTLDGLRALLDLILITAAMVGHHLTCSLLHLV